jgi:type II secretory pathway pseudopilin PulG
MVLRRHPMTRRANQARAPRGFMLLALLIGLTLASITLMAAVDIWTVQRQREKEQDLLFVGDQYRQAIQRYYFAAPPGTPRVLPVKLADLLEDDRYPIPVRHLRRLYPDPVTGQSEWGEVRVEDRIAGVYSLSEQPPIKQVDFPVIYRSFAERSQYREWVFTFLGAARSTVKPAIPGIGGNDESAGPAKRPTNREKP